MKLQVLYEDNHLIAVFKPAGVLAQGDRTGDESMLDEVRKYVKETYHKPGNTYIGLLHRLDRPVCGIMLFAKTSKGASRLSEQFRNRTVQKTYHALVTRTSDKSRGMLINSLQKSRRRASTGLMGGREAVLHYEVIESRGGYSLLKIFIDGGQFHQIRAQLSAAKMPIVGDVKYHGESWGNEKAIALCATGLSFQTATEGRLVNLAIECPKNWEEYLK